MRAARIALLIIDIGAAIVITTIFIWALRGAHRFPTEAAVYVTSVLALLLANAAYIWRQPGSRPD
jgi:hypothetical protein